jgi:hypothetical protein
LKPIRLGFVDTFKAAELFFTDLLSKHYEVIRDDDNPEYLIFGDFGDRHWSYNPKQVRKIYYTGENRRPNYWTYDFAITFDHVNSPNHFRLPLYIIDMWSMVKIDKVLDRFDYLCNRKIDVEEEMRLKTDFCSFVVSNPNYQPRNHFFEMLSRYKKVDSGGKYQNNIGRELPSDDIRNKLEFLRSRKFNICFENGVYPGYVTEKIVNAFAANTIPIYFGDPLITREFNPKAFVHIPLHPNGFNHYMDMVISLDQNDELYKQKLSEPVFHNDIPNDTMYVSSNFVNWWIRNVEIR